MRHETGDMSSLFDEFFIQIEAKTEYPFQAQSKFELNDHLTIEFLKVDDENSSNKQTWAIKIEHLPPSNSKNDYKQKIKLGILSAAIKNCYGICFHDALGIKKKNGRYIIRKNTELTIGKSIESILVPLKKILNSNIAVTNELLTACEVFTSARLAATNTYKFIGFVSSLEPLCKCKNIPKECKIEKEFDSFLSSFQDKLQKIEFCKNDNSLNKEIIESLTKRIDGLKKESITLSLTKTILKYFADEKIAKTVKECYELRSDILHNGTIIPNLEKKCNEIEIIVRELLLKKINELF